MSDCAAQKGQSLVEYTIVLGLVVAVLMAIGVLFKRSAQGMIKVMADQVGRQENADQDFSQDQYMVSSYTGGTVYQSKTTQELLGSTTYIYRDTSRRYSDTLLNLGFTEDSGP